MKRKILVVGSGSFIAQSWRSVAEENIRFIPHTELCASVVADSDIVVNCALDPLFKSLPYEERLDRDLMAARVVASLGKRFVMLSTRRVYAPSAYTVFLDELSPIDPVDHYGRNKLESERRVLEAVGSEKSAVLRISNVYGYEFGRRSFFGLALTRLREQHCIRFDVSPFVERDFIAVEHLVSLLQAICDRQLSGLYNLGSGVALPLGRIAQWMVDGYGQGALEVVDLRERDSFVMDTRKLFTALGISKTQNLADFACRIKNIGVRLKNE